VTCSKPCPHRDRGQVGGGDRSSDSWSNFILEEFFDEWMEMKM
jgi:hypothetical protein